MIYGTGALVRSRAGHDKDRVFLIIGESSEYVTLVDGEIRTFRKPKCKLKKHVQIIHDKDEQQRKKQIEETGLTDEAVRELLQCYERKGQL